MNKTNQYRTLIVAILLNFTFVAKATDNLNKTILPSTIHTSQELDTESSPVNIFSVSAVFALAIVGYRFRKKII